MQHFSEEMARLMRTSNTVCFVFHPHSTTSAEPKRIGQRIVEALKPPLRPRAPLSLLEKLRLKLGV